MNNSLSVRTHIAHACLEKFQMPLLVIAHRLTVKSADKIIESAFSAQTWFVIASRHRTIEAIQYN